MKNLNIGDRWWFLGHSFGQGNNNVCFMNEGSISTIADLYVTVVTDDGHKFMVMQEDLYKTSGECWVGMEKLFKRGRS